MAGIYGIPESFLEPVPPRGYERAVELPAVTRHGRPDKATVTRRDQQVLTLVRKTGSISRMAVAEELGLTSHEAYLSLSRISHTGAIRTVRRNNAHVWVPVDREV
jgi:hypothetical protein